MRNYLLLAFGPCVLLALCASAEVAKPSSWQQVQGLGPHTRIRIKSDKENATCFVHFVEEQQLSCARSEAIGSPVLVFPRGEIKTINLLPRKLGGSISTGYVDDVLEGRRIYQR